MHFIIHQSTASKFIILVVSCFCILSAGCASTAGSASLPVETETVESATPTPSPSVTPTRASASGIIAISSPTPTPPPTADSSVSDSLNLASPTPLLPTVTPSPTPRPTQTASLTPTKKPNTPQPTSSPSPIPITAGSSDRLNRLARDMVEAVNAARQVEGLPPYQLDEELTALAQGHAQDMAERGYRSHTTPEGKSYADRLTEAGISPRWRGENFVVSTRPADEAVQDALNWWMDDPPHRHNVLHPQHTHVGVGVAQTSEGWYIFVMDLVKR